MATQTNWRTTLCRCRMCGWVWLPRIAKRPNQCPRCRTQRWEGEPVARPKGVANVQTSGTGGSNGNG